MGFIETYKENEKKILAAIAVETARLDREHQRLTAPGPVEQLNKNGMTEPEAEALRRRTKEIEKKIAETKTAIDTRTKYSEDPLSRRDIPGMFAARARQRTGEHNPLEASDMEDGHVILGRRSFRTGQTRR
jgi:hypothetical protein